MSTVRQFCAACAAVAGAVAAGSLLIVAAGTPGLRIQGSVSQLGAVGEPLADTYQAAIFAIAIAVALLAIGVSLVSRLAATVLTATAALGALSATVPCTPGCPLPPTATATAADVIHVAASSVAFTLLACAMLILARSGNDPLARVCRYSVVLVTLLGTPVAVAIVVTGEGLLNGVLERAMMAVALAWLVTASIIVARFTPAQLTRSQDG